MVGHGMGRSHTSVRYFQEDVFPALGAFIGAGVALGMAAVLTLTVAGIGNRQALRQEFVFGGAIGGILGLFVGLGYGHWRPGNPATAQPPPADPLVQLWDPWIDSGSERVSTEPELGADEPAVLLEGIAGRPIERAPVRPRAISADTLEAVLLEDEIGSLIQRGERGLVQIVGGPGSGKSTAVRHLAAVLPPWARERVQLIDESGSLDDGLDRDLIVSTGLPVSQPQSKPLAVYGLTHWGQDDLIEYLLAVHRERCASVMARLKSSGSIRFLRGIPELWTVVLDLMAADASIADVRSALRSELAARLRDERLREMVEELCLTAFRRISSGSEHVAPDPRLDQGELGPHEAELIQLIRHQPVMILLAAERLIHLAECGQVRLVFSAHLPRQLIQEAALLLSGNTLALQNLVEWIDQSRFRAIHPMVASLLHAVMPVWRPEPSSRPRLAGAYLDGANWPGVNLEGVDLRSADLETADLCGANLDGADARHACFCRADLRGAYLNSLRAEMANLSGADLRWAKARGAKLSEADLADAHLIDADLSKADLRSATIDQADFSGALLEVACLKGLDLRLAKFEGARFGGADLSFCNLEEMQLTSPDFHDAKMLDALLTGSRMPGAIFLGADLRNAGLAEVDWPEANLRNADLRGARFHLGSSRNGLVGSTIACEGSRTGFYTDDYHDQNVKPAEEIRKANLQGADLRGANIEDVDFYLVDLRGALYTSEQAKHFQSCRAILGDHPVRQ